MIKREEAEAFLKKRNAAVELVTYEGGHGWKGSVYGTMRKGIEALTED